MSGRIIWFAALMAIAGLTAGVQLDRQSAKTPELTPYIPGAFRSTAQLRVTALAIDSGAADVAVQEAQRLVRRRPVPARHLRLLAQAQFAADELEGSGLAIQYAAQRGWREPLAQEAMMRLAIAAGDREEAARRYAALLVTHRSDRTLLEEVGNDVFLDGDDQTLIIFAEIVRGGDRWHRTFLSRGARIMPPGAFVEVLELSVENGAQFQCRSLRQAQRTIAKREELSNTKFVDLIRRIC